MNIIVFQYHIIKKALNDSKRRKIERACTRAYYNKLDEAIEKFKREPRKYYIVQKDELNWEVLGSHEIRKLKKFREAKHDLTFMKLHEIAPYVCKENISRLVYEQSLRRTWTKWYRRIVGSTYTPVSEQELLALKIAIRVLRTHPSYEHETEVITKLYEKHKR